MGPQSKPDCFTIKTMPGEPIYAAHVTPASLYSPVPTQPGGQVWGSFAWMLSHSITPILLDAVCYTAAGETEETFAYSFWSITLYC